VATGGEEIMSANNPNRVIGAAQFDRQEAERLAGTIDATEENQQRGDSPGTPIFDTSRERTGDQDPYERAAATGMTSEEQYFEARRNREQAADDDYAFSALSRVSR
jgi:hypothetical protein